jgi:ATPase, YjeE family
MPQKSISYTGGTLSLFTGDAEESRIMAEALGRCCTGGEVLLLVGDLGAGKTSFTQGLARGLEVDPTKRVTSPTFTLHGEYPGRLILNHLDLYRLTDVDSAMDLGVFDMIHDPHSVLVVEWPELIVNQIHDEYLRVAIDYASNSEGDDLSGRRITTTAAGEHHKTLLEKWHGFITTL